jgi:hypothetical protein
MFVLYSVAASAAEQLKPHLVSMLQLLNEVIQDTENRMVPYYAIRYSLFIYTTQNIKAIACLEMIIKLF